MAVTETVNFGFPKPDPDANVDEEFYRLQDALDMIDAAIKAARDLADGKADGNHGHAIEAIEGLALALENKMSANREFALDDLTDVSGAEAAPEGYLLVKGPGGWNPGSPASVLGDHEHALEDVVGLADALALKLSTADFGTALASLQQAIARAVPAGAVMPFSRAAAPTGWLKANGAAVLRADYTDLDAAIYVGNTLNATALSGYRCTNPANPTGTRSTSGTYIVLPDLRGEFIRGLDDGRGIDASRVVNSAQADELKAHLHSADPPSTTTNTDTHSHTGTTSAGGAHGHNTRFGGGSANQVNKTLNTSSYGGVSGTVTLDGFMTDAPDHTHTFTTATDAHNHTVDIAAFNTGSTGGAETRPRNVALLYCIKF